MEKIITPPSIISPFYLKEGTSYYVKHRNDEKEPILFLGKLLKIYEYRRKTNENPYLNDGVPYVNYIQYTFENKDRLEKIIQDNLFEINDTYPNHLLRTYDFYECK